jgi:hypothetical protein
MGTGTPRRCECRDSPSAAHGSAREGIAAPFSARVISRNRGTSGGAEAFTNVAIRNNREIFRNNVNRATEFVRVFGKRDAQSQ